MRIVTHNGKIHSDEVSSIALLSTYFSYKNHEITVLRTRDFEKFLLTDILVDVGLEYNHDSLKYDHHQKDFNETWSDKDTVLLSCLGLIWRHYGSEIIEMYLTDNSDQYDDSFNYSEETINELKDIIYYKLFQEIDATDNCTPFGNDYISPLVAALNGDINDEEIQNENFNKAVELVGNIFNIKFKEIINSYFNFQKDLETVKQMNLSGPYLIVDKNIPTIFKCLTELDPENKIKFCIFVNQKEQKEQNEYTIKARNKFNPVCPILSEDMLRQSCNENDIIFVHKGGFLAKTKTLETARLIINLSLLNMINFKLGEEFVDEFVDEIEESEKFKESEDINSKNTSGLTSLSFKSPNMEVLKDKRVMGGLAISLAALGFLYWNKNESQ
jgi:uncharacterized UPF0160 family protein